MVEAKHLECISKPGNTAKTFRVQGITYGRAGTVVRKNREPLIKLQHNLPLGFQRPQKEYLSNTFAILCSFVPSMAAYLIKLARGGRPCVDKSN